MRNAGMTRHTRNPTPLAASLLAAAVAATACGGGHAVDGDAADDLAADASRDPLAGLAPATEAQVRAASVAAWDAARGWAVLASGGAVIIVEPASSRAVVLDEIDGAIDGLAVGFDQLVVGREGGDSALALRTYDLDAPHVAPTVLSLGAIGDLQPAPPLTLIGPDQLVVGGVVGVELVTGAHTSADRIPHAFVYDPPQVAVRDGMLWTPSAYPGEVVVLALDEFPEWTELARIPIDADWLHAVTLLDGDRALVAGHLGGLAAVRLDVTTAAASDYALLDDGNHTYAEQIGHTVYAIATEAFAPAGRLLCIDPVELTVRATSLPVPVEPVPNTHLDATLLGEVAPGVARVFVRGVGLVELPCGSR
jgi:hypothetical protein